MPLKHKIDKIEDVVEAHRGLYEAGTDGKYYLQVEGMVPTTKLDEFRDNNIRLSQELTTLKDQFKDVDVVKYKEMLAAAGKTPEQIEEAVKARVKQLTTEHATALAERDGTITKLNGQLNTVLIDGTLKAEAAKAGVLVTALDDVVLRGRQVYSLNDKQQMIAKDAQGNVRYDVDGTSNLPVAAWLKDLKKNAPHLFEGMRGSGGNGNGGQGGQGGFDMSKATAQQKIAAGLATLDGGQG